MEDLTAPAIQELFEDVAWAMKSTGWSVEHEDLVQELWLWHLSEKSNRTWMQIQDPKKRRGALKRIAYKIGSAKLKEDMLFNAKYDYAVDVVKMILKGEIRGEQSVEDLALAIENLRGQNEDYADVIIKRHYTEDPVLSKSESDRLTKAYIRLTDEMNRIARERAAEFEDEPGQTLGDGLGRPKPIPFPLEDIQREPQPASGYYTKRKPSTDAPRIPRHEPKSLRDIRRS